MGLCLSSTIKSRDLRGEVKMKNTSSNISFSPAIPETETETEEAEGMILKSPNLKRFCYNELKAATRNFRPCNVLGEGGFGTVFKGWIDKNSLTPSSPETGMVVAVKRLNEKASQGQQEFLAEIKYLGQLYHPNLVKLFGYCTEDHHRLLVYEFMPKGSLDNSLYTRRSYIQPLSWNLRLKIALGTAKGLAFLHNKAQVIYRDLTTSNILLDQDGPTEDKSHLTARTLGSYGYSAPEYTDEGRLSTKVDVYSYGVVLLEIVSGRAAIDRNRPSKVINLVDWAKLNAKRNKKVFLVLDGRIEGENALRGALQVAELAIQCLSTEPGLRPTMNQVVKALELLL